MCTLTRAERFKDARTVHNIHGKQTMNAVQEATGVSASLIADLESDERSRKVNYMDVAKLAKHYGVTLDWLCGLSEDHHVNPCASSELGLSENSIYFLNNLRKIETSLNIITHPQQYTSDERQAAMQTRSEAIEKLNVPDGYSNSSLPRFADLYAANVPALVDLLVSDLEKNHQIILDFDDLKEAQQEPWDIEKERISHYDFVRFKASEISKAIDNFLVSEFARNCIYHDKITDGFGYLFHYKEH